jgi:hypothetical protein
VKILKALPSVGPFEVREGELAVFWGFRGAKKLYYYIEYWRGTLGR